MTPRQIKFLLRFMATVAHGDRNLLYTEMAKEVFDIEQFCVTESGRIATYNQSSAKTRDAQRIFGGVK